MSHGLRSATVLAMVFLVARLAAHAATIEISVAERGAGPIPNQNVALYPVTPEIQSDPMYFYNTRAAGRCTTGPSGRCEVTGLRVGTYVPYLFSADPNLVAPIGPPMVAFGTATLSKPDATARLRIELQRGVRILFRVVSERAPIPARSRVELTNDSGEQANAAFDAGGNAKITLVSGRWVAHLAGPSGARVVMVELDGDEVATLDVPVELNAPSSDRFVTWTLSPPCYVRGQVTTNSPDGPKVAIEATLSAPGAWAASALCRATNCAPPQKVGVDRQGRFAIELPSGAWRVAPTGDTLLESNPPFRDLACDEGQELRVDFDIREKGDGDGKEALVVRIVGDEDRPVADAPVELWPSTGNLEASRPIATESTERWVGMAWFKNLSAGSYLLRARSPGYRIAVVAVPDFNPEKEAPRYVTIRLDRGAAVDALALDDKDRPVAGVGLKVKCSVDAPGAADPASRLALPEAEFSVPPGNDQTGHTVVTGLSAGTYEVTPVLAGSVASTAAIGVASGDRAVDKSVVVHLDEHDRKDLSIRVRAAAALAGRLACTDGGLLPHQADACILGLPGGDENDATRDACGKPVIPSASVTLSGDRYDEFVVGPLTPGSFRLGLRPRGYTSFTWALGTPDGEHAAVVQINENGLVDLGAIPVLCGPAVLMRPKVLSHDPLPDLTLATVTAELTRPSPDGKVERRVVPAERSRERVAIRELPEGEWTLAVTMSHPFFVPAVPVHVSVPVKLERGVQLQAGVDIAAVGGAIVVDAAAGAARLSGADGVSRLEAAKDGRVAIDGVAPGTYRAELCEDASCARVLRRWDGVQVVRGKKVVLAAAEQPITRSN